MAQVEIWYKDNEMLARVSFARNAKTGAYLTGADTVRLASVKDDQGQQVANVPAPLALDYVAPDPAAGIPDGTFDAILPATAGVVVGQTYTAVLDVNPAGTPRASAELEIAVRKRRA